MADFLKGPPLPHSLGYTVRLQWMSFYLIPAIVALPLKASYHPSYYCIELRSNTMIV